MRFNIEAKTKKKGKKETLSKIFHRYQIRKKHQRKSSLFQIL